MGKRGRVLAHLAGALVLASCTLTTTFDDLSSGGAAFPEDSGFETTTPPIGNDTGGSSSSGGDGSSGSDGEITDGSLLGDVPTTTVDACNSTDCFDMPAGFSLVAFASAARPACPSGFAQPTDIVEGPALSNGACSCQCSVTANPTCPTNGPIANFFAAGGAGLCGSAGGNLANVGCGTDSFLGPFGTGNEHRNTPPPPVGGTCSATPKTDTTKLTYSSQGRMCQATTIPQCNAKICRPAVTAPFAVCIAATGNVACPAGFTTKHPIGASGTFTCGGCNTCTVSSKCTGKLDYFSNGTCAAPVAFTTIVDDACHPTVSTPPGLSYGSHIYTPNAPINVACTGTGSTSSTPTLNQATTVCCSN